MNTTNSIAESLSEARRSLFRDLTGLENLIHPGSKVALRELQNRLSRTYTHLCEHFRLEEKDGYMDNLADDQPRFHRVVEQLGDEHRALRRALDMIHADTIVASGVDEDLLQRTRDWVARVRQHETRENDLVQDATDLDVGTQD
jgi:hypothetical protein